MAGNIMDTQDILGRRWQSLNLKERCLNENAPASEKADATRNILSQLEYARAIKTTPDSCVSRLLLQQHEEYGKIVDASADVGGLDNFAEDALSLLEGKRNESKQWQSSLTLERTARMECVQKYIQSTKNAQAQIYGKENKSANLKLEMRKPRNDLLQQPVNTQSAASRNAAPSFSATNPSTSSNDYHGNPGTSKDYYGNPGTSKDYHGNDDFQGNSSHKNTNSAASTSSSRAAFPADTGGGSKFTFKNPNSGRFGDSGQPPDPVSENRKSLFAQQQPNARDNFGSGSDRFTKVPSIIPHKNNTNRPSGAFPNNQSNTNMGGYGNQQPNNAGQMWNNGANNNPGNSNFPTNERSVRYPNQGNMNNFGANASSFPNNRRPESVKRPRDNTYVEEDDDFNQVPSCFKTAKEQLAIEAQRKNNRGRGGGGQGGGYGGYGGGGGGGGGGGQVSNNAYGTNKKSLGTRRNPNTKFVPPIMNRDDDDGGALVRSSGPNKAPAVNANGEPIDERLKNIDEKMIELIMNEVMDLGPSISWDDIAGLEFAKKTIKEIVVWPMLRPDIFTGLRGPPKGLLLFGPPGTGKTLIGKCIASQSKSTFFSISASSLTSKWVGEGEKMVRALFAVARVNQPAVIFIDEIDSLLSQRSDGEHEASRRIKTEFLVQLDGATTGEDDRILVVGATNRPQEIDEAARRRFVKRLYIPLPEGVARTHLVTNLMRQQTHVLSDADLAIICQTSEGYSGADMANLCREAALGPIRSIAFEDMGNISADQVRPIVISDFQEAFKQVRASVSDKDLDLYIDWNKQYGSFGLG